MRDLGVDLDQPVRIGERGQDSRSLAPYELGRRHPGRITPDQPCAQELRSAGLLLEAEGRSHS